MTARIPSATQPTSSPSALWSRFSQSSFEFKVVNFFQVRDVEGYRATVKYIGCIVSARPEDDWIGVEWDDHSRGKHDGQAYGRRYFTTDAGRGSFVRAEKLVPRLGLDEAVYLKCELHCNSVSKRFVTSGPFRFHSRSAGTCLRSPSLPMKW